MAFRFQKRIKILPGVRLNISKTGAIWTVGRRGASVTTRDGKLTGNLGVPGTGMSYRKRLDLPATADRASESPAANPSDTPHTHQPASTLLYVVLAFVLGLVVGVVVG